MIDVPRAEQILRQIVQPGDTEAVSLRAALGRVLAEPVQTDVDYPPFDRAVMDGYAVRAADTVEVPARLRVVGTVNAGYVAHRPLAPGEAMQINTGAPVPPGADAVVRSESTRSREDASMVEVDETVTPGTFIARRGAFATAGAAVLVPPMVLHPLEMAAAAAAGAVSLTVYRVPSLAILTTGDELVPVEQQPASAQIRNSNQYLLEALAASAGVKSSVLGVAHDRREELRDLIEKGMTCDILCITGGVSMGAVDLVPEVLADCDATFHIRKMAIKPGRPVIFATTPSDKLVFALPGNPVSAFIGFELLVRPAIRLRMGLHDVFPRPCNAVLRGRLASNGRRRAYWPASVAVGRDGMLEAAPLNWHGSGDPFGMAGANGLIMRPPDAPAAAEGNPVPVLLLLHG